MIEPSPLWKAAQLMESDAMEQEARGEVMSFTRRMVVAVAEAALAIDRAEEAA